MKAAITVLILGSIMTACGSEAGPEARRAKVDSVQTEKAVKPTTISDGDDLSDIESLAVEKAIKDAIAAQDLLTEAEVKAIIEKAVADAIKAKTEANALEVHTSISYVPAYSQSGVFKPGFWVKTEGNALSSKRWLKNDGDSTWHITSDFTHYTVIFEGKEASCSSYINYYYGVPGQIDGTISTSYIVDPATCKPI